MIKNIFLYSLLLTLSVSILTGCRKEEISLTSGEVTANELKAVIDKNGIKRVYPVKYNEVFPDQFPADGGTQWSFSNGFIQVNYNAFVQSYNLNFLVGYGIQDIVLNNGSADKALILYMK